MIKRSIHVAVIVAALVGAWTVAAADDKGWTDVAEFSFVATNGNSESTSLGLKNTLAREWDRSGVTFRAGAIRVETTGDRFAENGVVMDGPSEISAESYYANGRYDHKISERFFWFAGAGWERNEPSGIKNRTIGEGGLGNTWFDRDDAKFKTSYGVTYTDQEDVVENPDVDGTFLGVRFAWDYMNKFGANTTYTNVLVLDENLDETSDWRADMDNGLSVAMSERLALKVGLQLLYDNEPAIELVPNTPAPPAEVQNELDELDTILTISLVVNVK